MSHNQYTYSVLMSVYKKDNPQYVELAIDSMLKQTVLPEQYVIVQDGPLEKKLDELIQRFQEENKDMFTIIKLPQNSGLPVALNEGLKYCRNELVARMDADDISLPNRCEEQLKMFMQEDLLDLCGCNINEFFDVPENLRRSRQVPSEYGDIVKFMRRRSAFNHPTVMYKKDKVLACGGYATDLKRKQDFDLFSKMISSGCYARNIDKSLLLFRADENNYGRRKNKVSFKCGMIVHWRRYKRKGCNFFDLITMWLIEIGVFIMPISIMKKLSDMFLRKAV